MRRKIVEHLCRDAPFELAEKAGALIDQHGNIAAQLVAAGFEPPTVLDACCSVTGLPPAPLQWLRDPRPPDADGIDPALCKKLGAAPIASTAGRLCIAYADPEVAAHADTLGLPPHVVYLALSAQLEKALSLLSANSDEDAATRAVGTAAMLDEELPTTAMPGISASSLAADLPEEPEEIEEAEPMEAADFEELPEDVVEAPDEPAVAPAPAEPAAPEAPARAATDDDVDQEAMTIAADVAALRAAAQALDDPTGASSVDEVQRMEAIAGGTGAAVAPPDEPLTPFEVPTDAGPLAAFRPAPADDAAFDVPTDAGPLAAFRVADDVQTAANRPLTGGPPAREDELEDRTASVDAFSAMEGIDLAALDRAAARRKEAEKRERKAAEERAEQEALAISVEAGEKDPEDDEGMRVEFAPPSDAALVVPREAAPLVLDVSAGANAALATDATVLRPAGVSPPAVAPPAVAPPTVAPPAVASAPRSAGIHLDEASSFLDGESAIRPGGSVRAAPESSLPRARPVKELSTKAPAAPSPEASGASRRFEVSRQDSSLPTSRPPTSAAEVSGAKPRAMVSLDPDVAPAKEATGKMSAAKGPGDSQRFPAARGPGDVSGKNAVARGPNEASQRNPVARGPGESGKNAAARGESGKNAAARGPGDSGGNVVAMGPPAEGGGSGKLLMAAAAAVIVVVAGVLMWKGEDTTSPVPPTKTRPVIPGSMDGAQDLSSRQAHLVERGKAEKDHRAAVLKFDEAISLNPHAPGARDAYYERARRHIELKAWRQAEYDLAELVKRPDTADLKDAIEKMQRQVAREKGSR